MVRSQIKRATTCYPPGIVVLRQSQLGFVPSGLDKWQQALGYIMSAFFALLVIGLIRFAIQHFARKSEGHN